MAGLIPNQPAGLHRNEEPGTSKSGSGVRRWASRLLQRGLSSGNVTSSSGSPQVSVGNGSLFRAQGPAGQPPSLPPKTPRPKPVPPPRTSSCLTGGTHQDLIRVAPPTGTPLPSSKSVRFGQQHNAEQGQQQDALTEATIGLEIAANLALAFARDVRRERMQTEVTHAATPPLPSVPLVTRLPRPPDPSSGVKVQQQQQQEVTLSEFYHLLQYVGHHHHQRQSQQLQQQQQPGAGHDSQSHSQSSTAMLVSSDPNPLPQSQATLTSALSHSNSKPAGQRLPLGYLTARSFRQSQSSSAAPSPAARRSHSVEVNHQPEVVPFSASATTTPSTPNASSVRNQTQPGSSSLSSSLKTRSLPRTVSSPAGSAVVASVGTTSATTGIVQSTEGASQHHHHHHPPPPVRHWAEILALITQVLSGADQYCPAAVAAASSTTEKRGTSAAARSRPSPPNASSSGGGGGSLSDSEEAYHRRRLSAATTSVHRERQYETLKNAPSRGTSTTRPSSRASTVAPSDDPVGHQSYLASLSQRLQIEQYIVRTLKAHLAAASGQKKEEEEPTTGAYIECWGSPERKISGRATPSGNSSLGLERALLRLDQRRTDRHPRIYQHHHWRITPAECNALFLCKMSDDDRLSLTTAVSDDDEGGESETGGHHHGHQSPFRKSGAAASFNCTGAVRKAGFLSVKKWLLRKKHQVELARKRGWRGYWVCLKGTTLLFYPCDSREGRHVEAAPKHLIIVDGAIMQPIPEHPQRDFIFCLSTAFGDAYLFQAPCQAELDTWVNSIHSACAAAFARHRGKTGTLHLLQEEILRLERSIESDNKLKHMAELQLSVVSETESRRQIGAQIAAWEENLERLQCEQFRLRCYMASLQHGELPNPKSLLTHVSRSTKHTLNRLGVFTVSSFHAYICARSPSLLNNLLAGRGATRRRAVTATPTSSLSRSNSLSSRKSTAPAQQQHSGSHEIGEKHFKVNLPDGQTATVSLKDNMTVEEFLASACGKRGLNPAEHFVRVKKRRDMDNSNHFVPHRTDLIDSYVPSHELVEICTKALYQVELSRNNLEQMWGFSVEAELVENAERQDELCVFVSRVEDRSVAMNHGIIKGDEIMVINGALVGDLDMMYIESVLQEELSLSLMIRSCRADPPDVTCLLRTTDDLIDSLVCPPPPSDQLITDDVLSNLIVPAPSWHKETQQSAAETPGAFPTELPTIQKHSPTDGSGPILRPRMSERSSTSSSSNVRRSSPTGSIASSQSFATSATPTRQQLTDGEKLKKCILELVETERTYVKHLNNLLENYLEPLKQETFLSSAEISALFGNIQEIVAFQRLFQQSLEEAIAVEANFDHLDQPYHFKNILFAIGSAFLQHANHFKLYSSFCASHSKAQKVLLPNEGSQALQEFLQSRNPRQQHSSTLESYLIKPIQRILKYPLLLQQLRNLTDPNSSEHQHLVDALKGMEKVAEHINEMQRIHEEYGAIFDHLFRQHQKSCKQPVDLSPAELLYYGGVEWLNISDFLGKVKKGLELHAMCFVFKSAVVFLCKERLRQRKKLMSVATKSTAPEVEIIRYQVLIPVTEVQVRTAQAKDMEAHYLWELIHLKNPLHRRSEKVYHLSNSTAEFRNAFLKTIRQIIRESVRNMSIPPAKPPVAPGSTPPTPSKVATHQTQQDGNGGKRNMQRHSAGNIDYDNVDACSSSAAAGRADDTNADEGQQPVLFRGRSQTFGENKKPIRRMDSMEPKESDMGFKSENEDDTGARSSRVLGRTPNHLSLSTTSTLSTGSNTSQAKLVQASRAPQTFSSPAVKPLGSPIWKPREGVGESFTLPRPAKSSDMTSGGNGNGGSNSGVSGKNSYGTLGFPSKK